MSVYIMPKMNIPELESMCVGRVHTKITCVEKKLKKLFSSLVDELYTSVPEGDLYYRTDRG